MHRLALVLTTLSLACSGTRDAVVTPEMPSSPSAVVAAPSEITPTVEAPPAEPVVAPRTDARVLSELATPAAVRAIIVPRLPAENARISVGDTLRIAHPSSVVRAHLDELFDTQVRTLRAQLHSASYVYATPEYYRPSCHALVATANVVSVVCAGDVISDERGRVSETRAVALAFSIDGDEVVPVSVADALVPGADLETEQRRVRANALHELQATRGDPGFEQIVEAIAPDGIRSDWSFTTDEGGQLRNQQTIYWADILDRVRADGVVARILGLGAYAGTAARAPSAADAGPWAFGPPIPLHDAATRWLSLPADTRAHVTVFASSDDRYAQLGVTSDAGADLAHALASTLTLPLVAPSDGAHVRRFAIVRTNGSVNVRAEGRGDGAWLGTLPLGAVALTLVDPTESFTRPWPTVVATPALEGHAASRYLEPSDCLPDATSAIAIVPEAARDEAMHNVVRVVTTSVVDGHDTPSALFLTHAGERSWVSLRRLSGACAVGDEIASWTLDRGSVGLVLDARVTRTAEHGGETLVLVALAMPGDTEHATWSALRVGAPSSLWQQAVAHPSRADELVAPAMRGPSGRGWWPLAIVQHGHPIVPYAWDGTTLVRAGR